jgi:RNA polymerase sigma-70 factor (ECF subfamily)
LQKSDEMLIEEIKNGNAESFNELMQVHQSKVYRIAFNYARSSQEAMDITQNIFLKVYANLKQFRGDSQFKTWLMRIAFNEGQNWVKKNRRHMMTEDIFDRPAESASFVTQEDEYIASENKAALLRSLYELNTKYRLAVILRYFENYSIKEIAATLDCSEGVVKNMLFRSLQKLKFVLSTVDTGENNEYRKKN